MPRTPVGARPQPETSTALFGYFAAKLSGIPVAGFEAFFRTLGIRIGREGAMRAMRPVRYRSPAKGIPGRKSLAPRGKSGPPAFREWLLINEAALGIETAFIQLPGRGRRQNELLAALPSVAGVRQIFETSYRRDVYALVIFRGLDERRHLRAQLEELSDEIVWDDLLWETHEPAIATWCEFARRAAAEENLR